MAAVAIVPQEIYDRLLNVVVTLRDQGKDAEIQTIYFGTYWRARLLVNGVTVKYFYRPSRGKWVRG